MEDGYSDETSGNSLKGLRVLALPVSALPLKPLLEAKARWNWHVDVLWRYKEQKIYRKLVEPSGQYFEVTSIGRQVWEEDAGEVAEVDRMIREVERATKIPVGQIVIASGATIGSCFAEPIINLISDPSFPKLSTQVDNLEPYRIVRRTFRFASRVIDAAAPDLIYFFEWADLWSYVVWLTAQWRGIPCVAIRRSKMRSDHLYATTDRRMFNVDGRELAAAKRASNAGVSDTARQYIDEFRHQPKMVGYIKTKWDRRRAESKWVSWHAQWARANASKIRKSIKRPSQAAELFQAGRGLFDFNSRFYRIRRQQRLLSSFSPEQLEKMEYVLFPVHKETDLSIYFQAAPWFDQRSTIRLLASVVPHGYRLLVREHPDNYGLRPSSYYRELLRLPNVVLIDPYDSQFKYIANADVVVTENGSSGWEGLLLGRKVIALSETFYDGSGLTRKVEKPEELGAAILEVLSTPTPLESRERDFDLGRMIDAEYETTFHIGDTEMALEHIRAIVRRTLNRTTSSGLRSNSSDCDASCIYNAS